MSFRHDYRHSKKNFAQFEGGNKLMPSDDLADFAESLQEKTTFPSNVINQAFNKLAIRKGIHATHDAQIQLMQLARITAESESSLKQQQWRLDEAQLKDKISAVIGRVRCRKAMYIS